MVCGSGGAVMFSDGMAIVVEMYNMGDPSLHIELRAIIEHVLSDRPGDWRVLIIGSLESDRWDMKITGPKGFERSYPLEGAAGQHEPHAVGTIVAMILGATP
jgi:hypothetical protein